MVMFWFFFFQSLDKSKAQCIHDSQYYNILQVAVCKRSNHLTTIVYPLPSLNVSISVTHNTLMLHNAALLYHAAYIYSMLNSQSCTGIQNHASVFLKFLDVWNVLFSQTYKIYS